MTNAIPKVKFAGDFAGRHAENNSEGIAPWGEVEEYWFPAWEVAESKSGIGYWRDVDASNVKSVIKGQKDNVVVYDSVDDFIEGQAILRELVFTRQVRK